MLSTAYAVVMCLWMCLCLSVCHTPVLYQNGVIGSVVMPDTQADSLTNTDVYRGLCRCATLMHNKINTSNYVLLVKSAASTNRF